MIAALPIAAGLLAILSDDETPDPEERFQRMILFERGDWHFEGMTCLEAAKEIDRIYGLWEIDLDRKLRGTSDREARRRVFSILFEGLPLYTVLRQTGEEEQKFPAPGEYHDPCTCYDLTKATHLMSDTWEKAYNLGISPDCYHVGIEDERNAKEKEPFKFWECVYAERRTGKILVKLPDTSGSNWYFVENDPTEEDEER